MKFTLLLAALLLFLTLITGPGAISQARQPDPTVPVSVDSQPLEAPRACTGRFKQHTLNHITTPAQEPVRMFDSNGSGLAVNDLDNDGDMDIVLANLAGPNTIFWNTGNLKFERQPLPYGDSRAVTIVDVNGDGRLDIVFSRRTAGPLYLRNDGPPDAPRFTQTPLPGVTSPAYALAWADLDQDGDLDLVTGSYDAELGQKLGDAFMFSNNAGVFYYQNQGGYFEPVRLAEQAQALAILLTDLNGDRHPDILVGNDFSLPDNVWLRQDDGWVPAEPFSATTHSTMSFDAADIDNNGRFELLATDMHPTGNDANTQAAWQPVMESMTPLPPGDPQIMENVLQVNTGGGFQNMAAAAGLAATGWSWSSKFADLDQDGLLDLYVVNGMIAAELFSGLPQNQWVEPNQALRNGGNRRFFPAPQWRLDAHSSGRGMSMADFDNDGDLDIVVNNLLSPALLFENQICGGSSLLVDLHWPQQANSRALGALLRLHTSRGVYTRDVRAASGYLSGDPARVHFGLPAGATISRLEIIWPDGARSQVEAPAANTRLSISRD